jgi:hypothetical protein
MEPIVRRQDGFVTVVTLLFVVLAPLAVRGQSPSCSLPSSYPGEGASRESIAAWMAARALAVGLPEELPVMAALVESGLQNLNRGDADSVGFFQMRVGIWNKGIYAGYPNNPELQVKWFLDQATAALNRVMAGGNRGFGAGPEGYGRWIADTLGPVGQRRQFQEQLDEARRLISLGRFLSGSWPFVGAYPGDAASRSTLAAWIATRAVAAGLPGELPIMAALVESGLRNLTGSDGDSAGFFGMRKSIWNVGPYAGFPDRPELQVKWFIDQAIATRAARIVDGSAFFGSDPQQYGEWIADVERPAEEFRGRYQLRLDEARALMQAGCSTR